ncbi:hypothetical protein FS837_010290 [Tulasnella sp. UAMH 9824]|nr:hypothetical protein FS837_010290 [Tulasnella sp. UAMH 9824]
MVPERENLDSYIADHHHQRMKVLSLYGEHQIVCTRPLQVPHLEELYITRCNIVWDHLQNLRVLSVDESNGPNLAQLVPILQSSSRLERLFLRNINAASDGAGAPLNPIYLPQLSAITFSRMSFELALGILERLITSAACRISDISRPRSEGSSWLGFFHHAGRICTPQRPGEQIIDPQLSLINDYWHLEAAPGRHLHTLSFDDQQTTMGRLAEAARMFFATSKGLPFTARSSRFRLELQYMSHVAEGLEIVHENFPETVELDVSCREGLDVLTVLAEPKVEEGNLVWLLPNLAMLTLNTTSDAFDYGCIIAMAIERTRAATSSPSLAPIILLTLGRGRVQGELLRKLEEAGISYERGGVTVVG